MSPKLLKWMVCVGSLFTGGIAQAEDIDIFLGRSATSSTPPSVLIILDNTANWNTPFTVELTALKETVQRVKTNAVNLGLMMFTETGSGDTGSDGGYVRAAIRPLDSNYQSKFVDLVSSIRVGEDRSNGGKAALAMWEAYLYFSGLAPRSGNNKNKTDYSGNGYIYYNNPTGKAAPVDVSFASREIWGLPGNALASKSGTPYIAPSGITTCGKTYIVYISNGPAQDNASDIAAVNAALVSAGGDATQIRLSPSGSQDNPADEVARFMSLSSLATTVYTVDVNATTDGQGPGWTELLKSMASVSNGKYFGVSSTGSQIADALDDIFTEIQSVNSSFASVSLPVSVNTQGTYLNQVYIGQFRPDQNGYPRWQGNLKQYKIGSTSSGDLLLQDAAGNSAINSQTGFITPCARSYWTPSVLDTYWSFQPESSCTSIAGAASSNYPDGNIVEKGGQAYRLRQLGSAGSRNVLTCSGASVSACTSLYAFNKDNVTGASLGVAESAREGLINWIRGQDTQNENRNLDSAGNAITTDIRPSIHGDVVHSRPVAINFSTVDAASGRKVVVFYGANDGLLRAVNGNRDGESTVGSANPGDELWSFAPPEFLTKFDRLRVNTDQIAFLGAAGNPKSYGMDGPVTHVKSGANTYIYAVMRRGGRAVYAFDVSTPESPSLKWKIGCDSAGCGTAGTANWSASELTHLARLGQTWSSAVPLRSSGYRSGSSSMLIMGGGYDTCEDTDTNSTAVCSSPLGNRIYVLDAETGALLKSFTTDRGVVGDVTVVNINSGSDPGLAQYAYAADLGGNVYRINIGNSPPAAWAITKVASLGCADTSSCAPRRKFMFGPDVVKEGDVYYVLLGSGDREKPLTLATQAAYPNARTVSNHFFAFRDDLSCTSPGCEIQMSSLVPITTSATPTSTELASKKGWYLALAPEEQTVTSAITLFGATTFSTTQPQVASTTSCTTLGTAKVYYLSYLNAASMNGTASRSETLPAGGLPPSPVAGKVILDSGQIVPFVVGARGSSPLDVRKPPQLNTTGNPQPTKRVYRFIQR